MRRYVLLVAHEPRDWAAASPEVRRSHADAHDAFHHFVAEHGRRLSSAALGDADTATTVHPGPTGTRAVTDGPFAELVAQVGGYYDVELPDLDRAIEAARLLPAACTVEVRPVVRVGRSDPS